MDDVAESTPTAPQLGSAPLAAALSATAPALPPGFVYALGQVEPRFPSLAVEKEFAQVLSRPEQAGLTDREITRAMLGERENRYLARQLCWLLVIEGLETYILMPRDPTDVELLIEAYREQPRADDLDVVIGHLGPIAPADMCNGLALPIVVFDQLYSFDRDALIAAIPRPDSIDKKDDDRFRASSGELFDALVQLADNAGATDEHRALNYLTVRYPRIYGVSAEMLGRNCSFTGVDVVPSRLSGARTIVTVIFSYRHRETDVAEKQFVRVDVTEEFPFLVTPMGPYYDR